MERVQQFGMTYRKQLPSPYPYETCEQYVKRIEQVESVLNKQVQEQRAEILAQVSQVTDSPMAKWYRMAAIASSAACAYHGYKRHEASGKGGRNAFLWFLFGGLTPFLALPIAFAQGFAKPKKL